MHYCQIPDSGNGIDYVMHIFQIILADLFTFFSYRDFCAIQPDIKFAKPSLRNTIYRA